MVFVQKAVKPHVYNFPSTVKGPSKAQNVTFKPQKERDSEQSASLGNKMFEYTEATVDEEIEKGLFQTKIGFSRLEEKSSVLHNKLDLLGYDFVKVVGLSSRKFILRSESEKGREDVKEEDLSVWFLNIRNFTNQDLVMARTIWV